MRSFAELVLRRQSKRWNGFLTGKMSPTRKHSMLQGGFIDALKLGRRLATVAELAQNGVFSPRHLAKTSIPSSGSGVYVGTSGGPLPPKDRELPSVAPEIVVEIFSPDDRAKDFEEKRRVYFA